MSTVSRIMSLTWISAPERIVQPRSLLTLLEKNDWTQEVKCRCSLQGFEDPDVLDF